MYVAVLTRMIFWSRINFLMQLKKNTDVIAPSNELNTIIINNKSLFLSSASCRPQCIRRERKHQERERERRKAINNSELIYHKIVQLNTHKSQHKCDQPPVPCPSPFAIFQYSFYICKLISFIECSLALGQFSSSFWNLQFGRSLHRNPSLIMHVSSSQSNSFASQLPRFLRNVE